MLVGASAARAVRSSSLKSRGRLFISGRIIPYRALRRVRYVCRMNVRFSRFSTVLVALVFVLVACGKDLDPSPTAVPTVTQDEGTPAGLTVGLLADRIATGWDGIDRYHALTTMQSSGSPTAASATTETVEEAILPDRRRQMVSVNGAQQSEIVAAGGNIYGRGVGLPGIEQPNRDPEVWITINGNVLGPNNAWSGFYQSLLLPVEPPYSALDEADRARPVEELDVVDVTGRACRQYRIVDTALTGERMEIVIALEESGLLCSIKTTSGNSFTSTVYTSDQPVEIALPASPVPAPAENG